MDRSVRKFMTDSSDLRTERTILALLVSFFIGLMVPLMNGLSPLDALKAALLFSILTGAIVAVLAWAVDTTKRKGYRGAVGFISVVIFNIFGILLVLLLPDLSHTNN